MNKEHRRRGHSLNHNGDRILLEAGQTIGVSAKLASGVLALLVALCSIPKRSVPGRFSGCWPLQVYLTGISSHGTDHDDCIGCE